MLVYFTNLIVENFQWLNFDFLSMNWKGIKGICHSKILTFDKELKIMAIHLVKIKD